MFKSIVQGVVLASGPGFGNFDPISTPKPLVQVGPSPLIIWTIEYLQQLGIEDIWIVVGSHGEQIQKALVGEETIRSRTHLIELPFQSKSMVHALIYAISRVSGPILVTPCDLIFDVYPVNVSDIINLDEDLLQMVITADKSTGPQFTDHASQRKTRLATKKSTSILNSFGLSESNCGYSDTGIYLIGERSKRQLELSLHMTTEKETFYRFLEKEAQDEKVALNLIDPGKWFDVNTIVDKLRAEAFIEKSRKHIFQARESTGKQALRALENSYEFTYSKKTTTQIVIQKDILNELWEYDVIPPTSALSPNYLVTDHILFDIVGNKIEEGFSSRGFNIKTIIVPPGEDAKTIDEFWNVILETLQHGLERSSTLINLGGGAINNVAGLAASTLFRGINLIHIPTTLLGQLDSTIDIKHAINTPFGKNLVGTFFAPTKVIVDPAILNTLSQEQITHGISESVKHGLVQDKYLLDYFTQYEGQIHNTKFLEEIIDWTIKLKVACMTGSPDGGREDAIKDYGHAIAHAIEQYSGYNLLHGAAISIGMCISAEIAQILEVTGKKEVNMHYQILQKFHLPTSVSPDFCFDHYEICQRQDKTCIQGKVYMGLISELGQLWDQNGQYSIPVDFGVLREAFQRNQEKFSEDMEFADWAWLRG